MLPSASDDVVTLRLLYMMIASAFVAVAPLASVARTVKFDVPAAVGVPLISPVVPLSVSPAGSAPTVTAHVMGDLPPLLASVWLYARFTVPSVSDVVVTDSAGYIVIESALSTYAPFVSVTRTVIFSVPDAVGVPLIAPVPLFKLSPSGSTPTVIDQVSGSLPPVDVSVWL